MARLGNIIEELAFLLMLPINCLRYNISSSLGKTSYPRFLVFYTTFRCDSRCKACAIWRGNDQEKTKEELSLPQIEQIFSDSLFSKLEHINIQGGEATLRKDLAEIVQTICRCVPKLKHISLTSNGLDSKTVTFQAEQVLEVCKKNRVHFSICFSIDGVESFHDFARGDNAFGRVMKTIQMARDSQSLSQVPLGTNCVLTAHNIYNLKEILKFQQDTFGVTNLSVVEFREHFLNEGADQNRNLLFEENPEAKEVFLSFLKDNSRPKHFRDFMAFRYEQIRKMLEEGAPRTQACQYKISGLVLSHRGELMLCPIGGSLGSCLENKPHELLLSKEARNAKVTLERNNCVSCYPYNFYRNEIAKDMFKYLAFYVRSRLSRT